MEEKNTNISNFAKYRGKLKELYSNEKDLYNRLGKTKVGLPGLTKIKTKDAQELFNEAIANPDSAADISTAAYYMSNAYASIIDYYKNFFYIRYTITPRLLTREFEKQTETGQLAEEYGKIYYRMMDSVEGLNLETVLPSIAEETLIKGKCGIVTEKHKISDTVVTFFLPIGYFKTVGKTQFGTNIIAFDFKYFKDLRTSTGKNANTVEGTTFESILMSMPKILQEGYAKYLEDENEYRWQVLDPKVATVFTFNTLGIPAKLGAFPASVDFNSYKAIKLEKAAQELDHVLTHQIPTNSDGDLIMDVDEALDVARNMKETLREVPEVKVVTTFGPTEMHDLSTNQSEQMDALNIAYNNIYSSAGVDYHVFVSDRDLEASIKRDKEFMWGFYQEVMLFYNVSFNHLINFNPYQAKINLLPISVQLEQEDVQQYIGYAGSGIGRLQAVIATGIKQSDLHAAYKVEEFLDFDKILKPLQSMYTSSYKANQQKAEDKPTEDQPMKEDDSNPIDSEADIDDEAVADK